MTTPGSALDMLTKKIDLMDVFQNDPNAKHEARLSFCEDGVTIDGHYFIEKEDLDTAEELLCRVRHLLGKAWVDKRFLTFFMEKISEKYGVRVHG
jgi:hypothetical protein